MKTLIILSLVFTLFAACRKKDNEVGEARRLPEDSINLLEIMASDDPASVKAGLETWLQYYPGEINRVFPGEATTALGLLASKYFRADDKASWLALIDNLLDKGADPNISFSYNEARLGMLHVASMAGDSALVQHLINRLGTIDPPLRLSCDVPRQIPNANEQTRLNINIQEEKTGRTPLHFAIEQPNTDVAFIEYLLLQGANPDIRNEALQLQSPFQLVPANSSLVPVFQKYSGPQIRYDARLNSFINDEIEKQPDQRKTMLDLAAAYQEMVTSEGFQDVQDINRVITLCQTGEQANLLGYALQYLFPSVSTKAAQAAKARNDSLQVWIKDYGAKICLDGDLSLRNPDASTRTVSLKDFFKQTLATHTQAASAPVKNLNKALWCSVVRPKAVEGGCWDTTSDETLVDGTVCNP
ncbi:MAG TPA: hypothetical protein VE954_14445 [Oligoflexus sp.]|uniref:hypothetical protein n=1 Tax=Oligoflexus sp. TaxID=1971216 RepID=UPI002D3C280B|nr:hypothetical protein [Oligoflexus sp.]HYX34299.1 hypothetical protein [Oligoflexus sp.]